MSRLLDRSWSVRQVPVPRRRSAGEGPATGPYCGWWGSQSHHPNPGRATPPAPGVRSVSRGTVDESSFGRLRIGWQPGARAAGRFRQWSASRTEPPAGPTPWHGVSLPSLGSSTRRQRLLSVDRATSRGWATNISDVVRPGAARGAWRRHGPWAPGSSGAFDWRRYALHEHQLSDGHWTDGEGSRVYGGRRGPGLRT